MKIGVIIASDDPMRLYVAATYIATEVARGNEVGVFVTGRGVVPFSKGDLSDYPEAVKMREMKVTWLEIFKAAKPLGVKVAVCETAAKIYGLTAQDFRHLEIVDEISSMYSFLEEYGEKIVTF
ncbi:conserved hypothetical protein [Pyrobaculum aerophilum str. IM2]|uniref:Uncharacterized protein n=2 Tax=Pyrobaculum aerophilum TaxID=13773 RepID=Q8ZUU3_PYRAE|nr:MULTISPECIES: DsrE family protein [Pyrobaculum]AAL64313.1 conserved hypothetical protein [Pyrobaculum aerophilum str. IM2]HII47929.1 peroxiredoxin [Pyrobaculum aerophilum]